MPGTKTPGRSVYLRYYAPVPNAKGKLSVQAILAALEISWIRSMNMQPKWSFNYYSDYQWFYKITDAQKRKREELPVFEQAENVENPLRCPVKLYEFYLSKA